MDNLITSKNNVISSISDFNQPFSEYLTNLGLPSENVLYPIDDRSVVINSIENAIKNINTNDREKAVYLTRFISSVAAGLFDGAVAYLWNETIGCLRKMIISFDLDYFYKICAQLNTRYKNLHGEDDLPIVGEFDLLTTCNRMGLITDHVFEVFKHINYMRNHSSSAHPNDNAIGAYDLLSWLDNCIKYAINAEPNEEAIKIKQLMYNIRTNAIPQEDLKYIGNSLKQLPQIMIDDLLGTLFGMYVDTSITQVTSDNITIISKFVWELSSSDKRYEIGEKYGYFRKNGDINRKDRANEFLTLVDGNTYKDEDSIAYEIREVLANLLSSHNGVNNFYNEGPWAKELKQLIPKSGIIPNTVVKEWVKVIVTCYAGNGLGYREGVDEAAESYYITFIDNFKDKEIIELLNLMDDSTLNYDIDMTKPRRRFKRMCGSLINQTHNQFVISALEYIVNCHEPLSKVYTTTKFKDLMHKVNIKI